MLRFFLTAGVALSALASPSWAEGPCGGTWLEPELFSTLPRDKQDAELRRLADGLREGCAEAYNGLGYLASAVPNDYPEALRWFSILVKVTETQHRQLGVQSALLDQFLKKIDEFSGAVKAAEDKASAIAAELAKVKKAQSTALAERDSAKADLAVAQESVGKAKIEVAALSGVRMELTEKLKLAEQSLGKSNDALAELQKTYDNVNATLNIKLAELGNHQTQVEEQAKEIERLRSGVKELESTLATRERERTATEERTKKLEQLVSTNAIELSEQKAALKAAEARVKVLTAELDKEAAKFATLATKVEELEKELKRATEEIASFAEKLGIETERATRFEAELKAETSRHETTKAQLSEALMKIERLTGELTVASGKVDDLTRQRDSLAAKAQALEADLERARAQITSLDNVIKGANTQIAALSDKLKQANDQIASYKQTVATLEEELKVEKASHAATTRELQAASAKVTVLTSELDAAGARNKVLNTENDNLREKIGALEPYVSEFLKRLKAELGSEAGIRIQGDRFVVPSEILFESGSSELTQPGRAHVEKIISVIGELQTKIPADIKWSLQISGHTDKQPVRPGSYVKDNWELSTRRALSVLRVMEERGISPARLSAAGYAERRPIAEGSSPQDLAQNRRIELKLTPD